MTDFELDDFEIYEDRPNRRKMWFRILFGLFVLYLFRRELLLGIQVMGYLFMPYLGMSPPVIPPLEDVGLLLLLPVANIVGAIFLVYLSFGLLAEVILPIRNKAEKKNSVSILRQFLNDRSGPVLFVREGKFEGRGDPGEIRGGVAIVDQSSAMVLESHWSAPVQGLRNPAFKKRMNGTSPRYPMARVAGPGLVFIRPGEQVRGVVNLRSQVRVNERIKASTKDGIEVETNVSTVFTLGQPATVIKVLSSYPDPYDLNVVEIDENTKRIKSISDYLDPDDKATIQNLAIRFFEDDHPGVSLHPQEGIKEFPPYPVDTDRIMDAIYWQGREDQEGKRVEWSELPARVATEKFRNLIAQIEYDDLYCLEDPDNFPLLHQFKPRFSDIMKVQGVVNFQLLYPLDDQPVAIDDKVDPRRFRISPVWELSTPKVLRLRGIKVIQAGFSELIPDKEVREQRLESWLTGWQQRENFTLAEYDREVGLAHAQARAEKQREMIMKLLEILKTPDFSEEALTLRVLQVLEDVAADPETRKFMPGDALELLSSLRPWLMVEEHLPPGIINGEPLPESLKPEE